MMDNFKTVNENMYGREAMIGSVNYEFLCFYISRDVTTNKEYLMVMVRDIASKKVFEFIFSNNLGLRLL
jgi:hypothetical protein